MTEKTIAVVIPTYNEKDNISAVVKELMHLPLKLNIIIVDDNSPDGTGRLAKKKFKDNPNVSVFIRENDRGRGSAGIFGFKQAIRTGAEIVGEMDGDFSHHPAFIPEMISAISAADAVIGSRYMKGGQDTERGLLRRILSTLSRNYIKLILGIRVSDPTSGFRFFKKETLEKIVGRLSARDPFIITETLFYLKKEKAVICEVPIKFYERKAGISKLRGTTLLMYLLKTIKLRIAHER